MTRYNNFRIQRPIITPDNQKKQIDSRKNVNANFKELLDKKINEKSNVKISKHAELRMKTRNINLSLEQMNRINSAVEKADQKGVKESLVLVDNVGLVVSIKNKTIITAIDSQELKDNVFTNIDGAVII